MKKENADVGEISSAVDIAYHQVLVSG
jgi:hypothetical protein